MKVRLSIATLIACCCLGSYFLETAALALEDRVHSAAHSIQGRRLLSSPNQNARIKVRLSKTTGRPDAREERTLGYEGTFSYENVTAGNYLITIESQDLPTIARAVELKGSLTPKTV